MDQSDYEYRKKIERVEHQGKTMYTRKFRIVVLSLRNWSFTKESLLRSYKRNLMFLLTRSLKQPIPMSNLRKALFMSVRHKVRHEYD